MYDLNVELELKKIYKKIEEIKYLQMMSKYQYQRTFYEQLIENEMAKARQINSAQDFTYNEHGSDDTPVYFEQAREFSTDELSKYDGKNGREAYVAIDGVVYDVTYSPPWAGGSHFGLSAGMDLTNQLASCHNKQEILSKLQKVGVVKS